MRTKLDTGEETREWREEEIGHIQKTSKRDENYNFKSLMPNEKLHFLSSSNDSYGHGQKTAIPITVKWNYLKKNYDNF